MTYRSNLADFVIPRLDHAVRTAIANGGGLNEAIATALQAPEMAIRAKRASPQERAALADALPEVVNRLRDLDMAPPITDGEIEGFDEAAQRWPDLAAPDPAARLRAATPEALEHLLGAASANIIAAADAALAEVAASMDGEPPSQRELAAWIGGGGCPDEALDDVAARLAALWELEDGQVKVTGWFHGGLATWREDLGEYHAPGGHVLAEARKARKPHALAPLVRAWLERPLQVEPNTRPDRILPARLAMVKPSDRRAGRLFTPAAHFAPDGQHVLPGFERDITGPALPLALYDLGAGPGVSRGKGAPVALRLFVTAILHVPMEQRDQTVVFELSLRDLQDQIWPGRTLSRARALRAIVQGGEVLDSMAARMPWHGGLYRVVDILAVPTTPDVDHPVKVRVQLPPGSGQGPLVTPTLADWGVRDAAAYRGLLNLAYRWHDPGVTRHPVGGGQHWIQSQDPERYPDYFDDDLVEIFYPTTSRKGRRFVVRDARGKKQLLADAGELRIFGRKLLPPLNSGAHFS